MGKLYYLRPMSFIVEQIETENQNALCYGTVAQVGLFDEKKTEVKNLVLLFL
jgi:hypothetical protein